MLSFQLIFLQDLFGEDNSSNNPETIVRADFTLSFQFPKLCFYVW